MKKIAPYGSWNSPITADLLVSATVRLAEPCIDGEHLYWIESRPQEKGRNAIVRADPAGRQTDVLPHPLNARSRVHEYGGGSYCVEQGVVYFVLYDDQRIYRLDTRQPRAVPEPLTPPGNYRYADLCIDSTRNRLLCVREDHSRSGHEAQNTLAAVELDASQRVRVIAEGADFYSNPRLSPDATRLSWLSWNHPDMPWDSAECWLAALDERGLPLAPEHIAGGEGESVFQPQWSPGGELFLVSDRNNWWNIYRYQKGTPPDQSLQPVTALEAEFATPQWVFGMSTYGFVDSDTLLACCSLQGQWHLKRVTGVSGPNTPRVHPVDTRSRQGAEAQREAENDLLTSISGLHCTNGRAVFLGASPTQDHAVWLWRQSQPQTLELVKSASSRPLDPAVISRSQAITFVSGGSGEGDAVAHGFFYPPTNPDFTGPEGDRPPLIVLCHGGPTGATECALQLKIQYWTSRGFAVLDVNYRGSTGYGRHYREQLHHNWGMADVEDVCAGARSLVDQGLVDSAKLAVKGGSAGGFTVLAALTFGKVFSAGASHYGIGDLEALARDTHKFESRYLDRLVGPYPEGRALYRARSPIHHTEQLSCPIIFFQGLEDKVVPPNQAEAMVQALRQKGIPVAYVAFAEEGHGFRQAKSIRQALEAELYFYGQLFGFQTPQPPEPVVIYRGEQTD